MEQPSSPADLLAFQDGSATRSVQELFADIAAIAQPWLDEACMAQCDPDACTIGCDTEAGAWIEYQQHTDPASGSFTRNIVVHPPHETWTRLSYSQTSASEGVEEDGWQSSQWAADWDGTLSAMWPADRAIHGSLLSSWLYDDWNEGTLSQEATTTWDDGTCAWSLAWSNYEWTDEGDFGKVEVWDITTTEATLLVEERFPDGCTASLNGAEERTVDCSTWSYVELLRRTCMLRASPAETFHAGRGAGGETRNGCPPLWDAGEARSVE